MEQLAGQEGLKLPEQRAEMIKSFFEEIDAIVLERHGKGNPYHNEQHPENVDSAGEDIVRRAEAAGIKVADDEKLARKVGAKTHDIVVRYFIDQATGKRVRLRGFGETNPNKGGYFKALEGSANKVEVMSADQIREAQESGSPLSLEGYEPIVGNEEASWQETEALMDKYDPRGELFTPYVKNAVRREIGATYPDFRFVSFKNTERAQHLLGASQGLFIDQPFLRERLAKATIAEIAVGAGDILYGGALPFQEFFDESNGEFREASQWIQDILEQKGIQGFSVDQKAKTVKGIFEWLATQPGFLLHQWERFEEILDTNEIVKNNNQFAQSLQEKYSHFEENIRSMQEKIRALKQDYGELTQESAYPASDAKFAEILGIIGYEQDLRV